MPNVGKIFKMVLVKGSETGLNSCPRDNRTERVQLSVNVVAGSLMSGCRHNRGSTMTSSGLSLKVFV